MAVITISRQFGAGGKTLGKMIADKLGYTFADDDIIQMVAEMANVSPHWVESVEKEAGGKLSRIISSMVSKRLVDRILKSDSGYLDEKLYLDYLVVIIAQIAEEGNVVIIGRGSQYILRGHPDAIHVLLINDFDNRVKFMQENYDLTHSKAVQVVNAEDRRRVNLYRKLGKTDYDDPSLYHMVLHTGRIHLPDAAGCICNLIHT
ncbi:MAG: cytidylate kinase [Deltaproteobacteria bacterium SG8_13]|nr:MAG: cytidylate kinase [Deltaproteobacteria bacterium SG8_13]